MPTVEHSTLTSTDLHEPKGIAGTSKNRLYVSNGANSGNWEKIQGFGHYQDSRTTVGSPAQTISTGVRTKFICNGAGNTVEYLPSDASASLWNTTSNKHTPISSFDTYSIRVSFTADDYSGTSPYITMELDIGGSLNTIVSETIPLLKSGDPQTVLFSFPVYTGATYLANGGSVYLTYTGTGTCKIFSNGVFIQRLSRNS